MRSASACRSSTPGPALVFTADLIVLIKSCFGRMTLAEYGSPNDRSLLPPIRPKLLLVATTQASSGGSACSFRNNSKIVGVTGASLPYASTFWRLPVTSAPVELKCPVSPSWRANG
jgi:hypothetical protein